jgi:hypothetical protein
LGEGVEFDKEIALLRRGVAVAQEIAADLGEDEKKKGDQHQRKGVGSGNAADLCGEEGWVTKGAG